MADTDLYRLSVSKLAKAASPFKSCVWPGMRHPLTRVEVTKAVRYLKAHPKATRGSQPFNAPTLSGTSYLFAGRRWHVQRVAWLVVEGWEQAIEIDVGVPSLGCEPDWIVCDGNHRLAAAIYRGDETILASCGGEVEVFKEFLL